MFAFAFECLCLVFSLAYFYFCSGHCLLGPAMPIHPNAHALCIAPCPPPLHKTWHSSLQIKPFHWIACGSSNVLLWTIIQCFQHVSLRGCLHMRAAFSVPVQVLQCLREPIKKPSAFFSVCHRPSIEKTASRGEKESAEQPKGSKQFKLQHLQSAKRHRFGHSAQNGQICKTMQI